MKVWILPVLLLHGLFVLPCDTHAQTAAERQHDVLQQLLPRFVKQGEPLPYMRLANRMAAHGVPGVSIAVIHEGSLDWSAGFGVCQTNTGTSVTSHTLFQAASISKPVCCLLSLQLREAGQLDLDTPVHLGLQSWQMPWLPAEHAHLVTLRSLLSHCAGMGVHGFPGYPAGSRLPTIPEILDGLGNTEAVRLIRAPEQQWKYSGGGYMIAQQYIEDVTQISLEALADSLVFAPLGMKHSRFAAELDTQQWSDVALAHDAQGNTIAGGWHRYPELAAAGLWTTAEDLAQILLAMDSARLNPEVSPISKEILAELSTDHCVDYSLGFFLEGQGQRRVMRAGGSNEGYRCHMYYLPERRQGAAVMTNGENGDALINEIYRAVSLVYNWPTYRVELLGEALAVRILLEAEVAMGDTVFICGNHQVLGEWDPHAVPMTFAGGTSWEIKLPVEEGYPLQYKFTLGSWEREGLTGDGQILADFQATAKPGLVLKHHVFAWQGQH